MSNLQFDAVDHEQGEIALISDREVGYVPGAIIDTAVYLSKYTFFTKYECFARHVFACIVSI